VLKFVIRLVVSTVLTLWAITTITFVLMLSVPGSPFASIDESWSPQQQQMLEERYGLHLPMHEQYVRYMGNLLQGDLGVSFVFTGRSVNATIARTFPPSARLGLISIVVSLLVGIYLGVTAALYQGKWQDRVALFFATLGITVPNFVIATLLIYVFGVHWRLLPFLGLEGPESYILPVAALSLGTVAVISRLVRSSVLDVIRQDYVRMARAKGLTSMQVTYQHVLRNALIPVVTLMGPLLAGILTGSFVVENIFAIPGMGNQLVLAIGNRDYSLILGMTIFFSFILVTANMLVDVVYGLIDPRIKLE
jgi:oligopeptide transport system permease protein